MFVRSLYILGHFHPWKTENKKINPRRKSFEEKVKTVAIYKYKGKVCK